MARSFFGRKDRDFTEESDWPRFPTLSARAEAPAPATLAEVRQPPAPPLEPDRQLLETIATARASVADKLYEISRDYQILCNMTHADLTACDEIIEELRRRLAGNAHYAVLAKLDEAHALAEAHITRVRD